MSTLKYTEDHEWLRLDNEDENVVTVGITNYAQEALGDIVFVQLPKIGATFAAGDEAAVIESVKAAGDLKMPLAGSILAINQILEETPQLVNSDPAGEGWFLRIRLDNPAAFSDLLDQAAYDKLIA